MSVVTPFSNLTNSTGKHKDWFGIEYAKILADQIYLYDQHFDRKSFLKSYKASYGNLELKQRLNLFVDLFDQHFDDNFSYKIDLFYSLLGEELLAEEGMFTHGFYLYPVSQYIERHGAKDVERSLDFIEELTKRFTGEWAIRTLANEAPEKTLKRIKKWMKHENFHVRRLASESLRARLPWGKKIEWIETHPERSLPIYQHLRHDPVLYVRRSVANAIGDMIRVHEDLAYKTLQKWMTQKKTVENLWVIKHAVRTPVKKGEKKFIALQKKVVNAMKSC